MVILSWRQFTPNIPMSCKSSSLWKIVLLKNSYKSPITNPTKASTSQKLMPFKLRSTTKTRKSTTWTNGSQKLKKISKTQNKRNLKVMKKFRILNSCWEKRSSCLVSWKQRNLSLKLQKKTKSKRSENARTRSEGSKLIPNLSNNE